MVGDLLWHELEILKSFFASAMSSALPKAAVESARVTEISNPDIDIIDELVISPHVAYYLVRNNRLGCRWGVIGHPRN